LTSLIPVAQDSSETEGETVAMMRSALILASMFLVPALANAGTCEAPTPMTRPPPLTSTTCGGPTGINMGGAVYPHESNVFSFTKPDIDSSIAISGTNREMSVVTSCDSAPPNSQGPGQLGVGFPGGPVDISVLPDGNYLLVVSTDPSIPSPPTVCGSFQLILPPIPVTLQKFEVN
jgi:hypothetical protein